MQDSRTKLQTVLIDESEDRTLQNNEPARKTLSPNRSSWTFCRIVVCSDRKAWAVQSADEDLAALTDAVRALRGEKSDNADDSKAAKGGDDAAVAAGGENGDDDEAAGAAGEEDGAHDDEAGEAASPAATANMADTADTAATAPGELHATVSFQGELCTPPPHRDGDTAHDSGSGNSERSGDASASQSPTVSATLVATEGGVKLALEGSDSSVAGSDLPAARDRFFSARGDAGGAPGSGDAA